MSKRLTSQADLGRAIFGLSLDTFLHGMVVVLWIWSYKARSKTRVAKWLTIMFLVLFGLKGMIYAGLGLYGGSWLPTAGLIGGFIFGTGCWRVISVWWDALQQVLGWVLSSELGSGELHIGN